jgi:hypothetical protein
MNGLGIVFPTRADRPHLPAVFILREYEDEQPKYLDFDQQEAVAHVLSIRMGDGERLHPFDLDAARLLAQRHEIVTHRTLEAATTEAMLTAIEEVESLVSSHVSLRRPQRMLSCEAELGTEGMPAFERKSSV